MAGLFGHRGRPVAAAVVPAVDEVKLRNLVAVRTATWRQEPTGIPRVIELEFFRHQLGREPSPDELAVIKGLWAEERRVRIGGAHGITTSDREPDRGTDVLARFDAACKRILR